MKLMTNFPTTLGSFQPASGGATDAFVTKLAPDGKSLAFSTYLGGSGIDQSHAVALDTAANIYVTGLTSSTDFPLMNPIQSGFSNGFVTKLAATGSRLIYSTFLPIGTSSQGSGSGIAVDASGAATVCGSAASGPFFGNPTGMLLRLNPAGSGTSYAVIGLLGDTGHNAVALDAQGNAYVTGSTSNPSFPFTPTVQGWQEVFRGGTDAYIAKFSPSAALLYYSYIGGSQGDVGEAVAVDQSGNAYVAGNTLSSDFPFVNAFQAAFGSSNQSNGFLTKIRSDGRAALYSTYFGGMGPTDIRSIAVTPSGQACIVGQTGSFNFPLLNPVQATPPGINFNDDGFASVFSVDGQSLIFSTNIGGSGEDAANGVALDSSSNIYVGGRTQSADFPVVNAFQPTLQGGISAFPISGWLAKIAGTVGGPTAQNATVSPLTAPVGTTITASFTASEPLAIDPVVTIGSQVMLKQPASSGLSYVFAWKLNGTEGSSPLSVVVHLQDVAGLTSNTTIGTVQVTTASGPAVVSPTVAPLIATVGTTVTASFSVNEPLALDPVVTIGSQPMQKQPTSGGLSYFFAWKLNGTEGTSPLSVLVHLQDAQGLTSNTTIAQVQVNPAVGPAVTSANVSPFTASVGTTITATFNVNETLSSDPQVTLGSQAMQKQPGSSGLYYTYARQLTGTEGSSPLSVVARLQDVQGLSSNATIGTVQVLPAGTLAQPTVNPTLATIGTVVSIVFAAPARFPTDPIVTVGGQTASLSSFSNLTYTYSVTISAAAGSPSPPVFVAAVDSTGKELTASGNPLSTDFVAPTFTGLTALPATASTGQLVTLSFLGSKTLKANPTVQVGGQMATFASVSNLGYTYNVTINSFATNGSSLGTPIVKITGADLAGNTTNVTGTPLYVKQGPAFTNITATPSLAGLNVPVTLSFTSSEPLRAGASVTVGGQPASSPTGTAPNYAVTFTPNPQTQNPVPDVVITGTGVSGFPTTQHATPLTLDFVKPVFYGFTASPSLAAIGKPVSIGFSSTKPLPTAPKVFVGSQSASLATSAGQVYTYVLAGSSQPPGVTVPAVSATGTDAAGNTNTSTAAPPPLTLDHAPPVFTVSSYPPYAALGTIVQLTVTTSKPLRADPTVTVGMQTAYRTAVSGLTYTYSLVVGQGAQNSTITVSGTDIAGNSTTQQFLPSQAGGLTTIFTPPSFTNIVANPNSVVSGRTVQLTFVGVGPGTLRTLPTVTVADQTVTVNPTSSVAPTNYSANFTATSAMVGHPLIAITGVDLAGNIGTTSTNGALTVSTFTSRPPVAFAGITASPNVATFSTTVFITFTANQPLASTTVAVNNVQANFVSSSGNPSIGLTYTYSFRVTQAYATPPNITISGSTGGFTNRTGSITVQRFSFDGTPPSIATLSGTPGTLAAGATALVTFTSNKALSSATTVTVGGQPTAQVSANTLSSTSIKYTYAYAVTPSSPQGMPTVQVKAVDIPGNAATIMGTPLTIDSVAPTLSSPSAVPSVAMIGTSVTFPFTSNKILSTALGPTVTVGGQTAKAALVSGTIYSATLSITTAAGTPNPVVTVTAQDAAGNVATKSGRPLTTDFVGPVITNITATPSPIAANKTVIIQFTSSKTLAALGGTSSVSVSQIRATLQGSTGAPPALQYSYSLPVSTALTEGLQTVSIGAIDTLGNVTFASAPGAFRTDFTAPAFRALTATPTLAINNTSVLLDFVASEPLQQGTLPNVTVGGQQAQFVSNTGLAYQYAIIATPSMVGSPPNVIITGTDVAGNSSQLTARPFTTDFNPLKLTSLAVSPTTAFAGTNVTVTFTANKPLVADPVVVVGAKTATKVSVSNGNYVYRITVDSSVGDGQPVISVDATDTHGYSANLQGTPLTTDLNAPKFYAITAQPTLVKAGVPVTIGFSSSKALQANPSVVFTNISSPGSQAATFTTFDSISLRYTYTVTFTAAIGDGSPLLTVQGADLAGNPGANSAQPVTTRVTPPQFKPITATPSQVAASQNVTISFSSTEGLPNAPVVFVGGVPASKATSSGLDYTYTVKSGQPMTEGQPQVSIQGIDLAGNLGKANASPLLTDYSLPLVRMSGSPNPSLEGGTVRFSSIGSSAISGIAAYSWDFGDGAQSTAQNPNHAYGTTGTYTVALSLTSGVGASAKQSLLLPVQNVSPSVKFNSIPSPAAGITPLSWVITDPGANDTFTYTLLARDLYLGVPTRLVNSAPSTGSYAWDTTKMADSSFQLSITVTDKDGGTASASSATFVQNHPLLITPAPPRPAVFNPTFGETTLLPYFLSQHAVVELDLIKSASQSFVTTLQSYMSENAGQQGFTWNGTNSSTGSLLPAGDYSYVVKAIDDAGNHVSASAALQRFTITLHVGVDAPTIDPRPTSPTRFAALTLTGGKHANTGITVARGATVLNSSAIDSFITWSSNVTLTEGPNALSVYAFDNLGLKSSTISTTVTLKTVAPAFTINPVKPATTTQQNIAGTKDPSTLILMNGNQVWPLDLNPTWNVTVNYLAGSTPFTFVAKDDVGNLSPSKTVTITLPANFVATPSIAPLVTPTNTANLLLSGTRQPNTTVEVTVVGISPPSSPVVSKIPSAGSSNKWTISVPANEGLNGITARSLDAIGSSSGTTSTSVFVDTRAPSIQVVGVNNGDVTTNASLPLSVTYQDPPPSSGLSALTIVVDGQDVTSSSSVGPNGASLPALVFSPGRHTVFANISDQAGNAAGSVVVFNTVSFSSGDPPIITLLDQPSSRLSPAYNPYAPGHLAKAVVRFTVTQTATPMLQVLSPAGIPVFTISLPSVGPGTVTTAAWDGRTLQGDFVDTGDYRMRLSAVNASGKTTTAQDITLKIHY